MPQHFRQAAGFTLIELVTVIVILGILSAYALPQMVRLSSDAKIAQMRSFAGALASGIALTQAKWIAAGKPGSGITQKDGSVVLFNLDYPTTATVKNVLAATSSELYPMSSSRGTSFCYVDGNGMTDCASAPVAGAPGGAGSFSKCGFIYYPPTASNPAYRIDTSYLTSNNCQ